MPLYPNAEALIRANLEAAARKQRPSIVRIGELSKGQLVTINEQRAGEGLPAIVSVVLFDGRHLHKSRCVEDGYTVDDVIEQIRHAFNDTATVALGWATVLKSNTTRINRNGNTVRDEVVFECHGRHPHPELLSVIPRGDGKNHTRKKKATR